MSSYEDMESTTDWFQMGFGPAESFNSTRWLFNSKRQYGISAERILVAERTVISTVPMQERHNVGRGESRSDKLVRVCSNSLSQRCLSCGVSVAIKMFSVPRTIPKLHSLFNPLASLIPSRSRFTSFSPISSSANGYRFWIVIKSKQYFVLVGRGKTCHSIEVPVRWACL